MPDRENFTAGATRGAFLRSILSRRRPNPVALAALWIALLGACSDDGSPADPGAADLQFIDLRVEEIGPTRGVVRFRTSRPATCQAEYGLAETALDRVATDPAMGPDTLADEHEVPLEDLEPATVYHYRARAADQAGRAYRSQVQTFTTTDAATTGAGLVNFSLRSEGTTVLGVSSNYGGGDHDSAWGAHRAIDGQMATEWASDGDGDSAWIALDFGDVRPVARFEFRSRQMADGSSVITRLRLRFDGDLVRGPFDTPDPDTVYGFDLGDVVRTRTARLEAVTTTGGNAGAREIRFVGARE